MTALVVGAMALLVAAFTLWGNARARDDRADLRRRLDEATHHLETCERDNLWMRQRLQLIEAALLTLLPVERRLELLRALGEQIDPAAA